MNAKSSELHISPILVPIEKIDLVKNLISDIEIDLSEKGTNVVLELSTFKTNCQELLSTNYNENLEILINEIDDVIFEYNEYKSSEQSRGVYNLTYSPAIAAIAAGFIVSGWELSAGLLLHARDNDELYSIYNPTFAKNVGYSQTFKDLVKDNTISGTNVFYDPNFLNFTKYDEDAYFSIHEFSYQKIYYNETKINTIIHDIYDYAKDTRNGLKETLNNLCYEAQVAGVLVPYFVVIDLVSYGNIPFKYTINGNNISIDKYLSNNEDFIIPEEIANHNLLYKTGEPVQKCTVKTISQNAFKNSNINNIVIPNTVTNIDTNAFEGCSNLQSVTLSTNLIAIGSSAFKGCASLESISIPNSVTHIDSSAFEGCSNLQSVTLSTNLIAIGSSAFKGCGSLGSITIPSSVQYIDDEAFKNCSSLSSVTVNRRITSTTNLGENAFDGCNNNLKIIVPTNRVAEYKNKEYWSSYRNKIMPFKDYIEFEIDCEGNITDSLNLSKATNELYKLNVKCSKSYKINTNSSNIVNIIIYDSNMNVVSSDSNTITQFLGCGTYYISFEFDDTNASDTFGFEISLTWKSTDILVTNGVNNIKNSIGRYYMLIYLVLKRIIKELAGHSIRLEVY